MSEEKLRAACRRSGRRLFLAGAAAAGCLSLLPTARRALAEEKSDLKLSGTIDVDEVQVAFLASGNLGGGTLHFKGEERRFTIGGLGVGGIGVASLEATGEVYNLTDLESFPGAYGDVRWGWALADKSSGQLWLQNPHGVVIHLKGTREGLMLTAGADAIIIAFE